MNGLAIFEALNDMSDDLVMSSLITHPQATAVPKVRTESAFRGFLNSGWGVAAICLLVSVSVLGGIIWAGQQPGITPPVSTTESEEIPTEEISTHETTEESHTELETEEDTELRFDPVSITEIKDEQLDLFLPINGTLEITEEQKLRVRGSWSSATAGISPCIKFNIFELMKAFSEDESNPNVPGAVFIKMTYENFSKTPELVLSDWGKTPEYGIIMQHTKVFFSPYQSPDVYIVISPPKDDGFAEGNIPYLFLEWYFNSGQEGVWGRSVVFEEIGFYPDMETALLRLSNRVTDDGYTTDSLDYYKFGDDICSVSGREYTHPVLIIPPTDENGHKVIGINEEAFILNDILYQVIASEGIERVGMRAFMHCTTLTEVYLPDSLAYIEDEAFLNCSDLKEIHIGKNLKYVGSRALPFYKSASLTDIYYNGTIAEFQKILFKDKITSNVTLHCTDGVLPISEAVGERSTELPAYATEDLTAFLATAEAPRLNPGERMIGVQARKIKAVKNDFETVTFVLRYGVAEDLSKEQPYRLYSDILSLEDGSIQMVTNNLDPTYSENTPFLNCRYSGILYMESSYDMEYGILCTYYYDVVEQSNGRNVITFGFRTCKLFYDESQGGLCGMWERDHEKYSYKEYPKVKFPYDVFGSIEMVWTLMLKEPRAGGEGRILAMINPQGDRIAFPSSQAPVLTGDYLNQMISQKETFDELFEHGLESMYRNHCLYKKES